MADIKRLVTPVKELSPFEWSIDLFHPSWYVRQELFENTNAMGLPSLRAKKTGILGSQDETAVFLIRSSWAQFCRFLRFGRVEKSISCVF